VTTIFKANNPLNNVYLFVYAALIKTPMFLNVTTPAPQQTDGFLYKQLLHLLGIGTGGKSVLAAVLAFILFYVQAVLLNNLANKHRLFTAPNYLVGMCYLLFTSLFLEWRYLSAPLVIATLAIWILYILANLAALQNPKTVLLNVGLIIGVATFFYFPTLAFTLMVLFGLALTRPFKIVEWFIVVLGVVTPYYLLVSIAFLTDNLKGYKFPGVSVNLPVLLNTAWANTAIFGVAAFALLGFFYVQRNFRKQLIQTRMSWRLVLLYLAIACIIPIINETKTFSYWILCAAPLAILAAGFFYYNKRSWVGTAAHWGFVVIILVINIVLR
jgi:hypothetical protein